MPSSFPLETYWYKAAGKKAGMGTRQLLVHRTKQLFVHRIRQIWVQGSYGYEEAVGTRQLLVQGSYGTRQ